MDERPFKPGAEIVNGDDTLADAIEADGRQMIDAGVPVGLERYWGSIPGLAQRPVPLDAAIDVALRSLAAARGSERPTEDDAEALTARYPQIASMISVALRLDAGLLSTNSIASVQTTSGKPRSDEPLPRDFGPLLADARPRYTLTRLIGSGASGRVYCAADRQLSEADRPAEVAIKLLAARSEDQHLARRLTEEATKARRIEHPSVVRVLDRGYEPGEAPYIVYELVRGGDLQSWFEERGRSIPPRQAAALVAQIARGIQAAHSAGLVHSDLKPANVLMDEQGKVKVADFGIAARLHRSLLDDHHAGLAPSGPIGNLAFIAPEQFKGEPGCFAPPADIYALGGLLYYLLTGRHPNGDSPAAVAHRHASGAVGHPPSALAGRVDATLDRVCLRALDPQAHNRYPSAAALADDLEAWIDHRPVAWQRPGAALRARLWVRRRPAVAMLTAGVCLSVLSGVAVVVAYARALERTNTQLTERNKTLTAQNQRMNEAVAIIEEGMAELEGQIPLADLFDAKRAFDKVNRIKPHMANAIREAGGKPDFSMTMPAPVTQPGNGPRTDFPTSPPPPQDPAPPR